jgi:hypothetical protein
MTLKLSTKSALLAGAAAVAFGMGASSSGYAAEAKMVMGGSDKVSVKISGQFSRQITYLDDGSSARFRHMDSNFSSSRFRIHADSKINADLSVSALAEIAFDDNRNALSNTGEFGARTGNDLQTRWAQIAFTHKALGKLQMGAGSNAADGVMNLEAHGVYGALPSDVGLVANPQYRTTAGQLSGVNMIFNADPDMSGRMPRLRYDTPTFYGFKASASHSDNQTTEAAVWYSGTMFDTKLKGALGITDCGGATGGMCSSTSGGNSIVYGAGFAAKHASGFGGNFHITTVEDGDAQAGRNPWYWNAQLHYGKKFSELGETTVVGEYMYTENGLAAGDVGEYWSGIMQQKIDSAALDIYLRYTNGHLHRDGTSFKDDINIVALGARMKF